YSYHRDLLSFPTRRSSDLALDVITRKKMAVTGFELGKARDRESCHYVQFGADEVVVAGIDTVGCARRRRCSATGNPVGAVKTVRSEEHTSELQSRFDLVCR